MDETPAIHGLMAEYTTPEELLEAAKRAYAEGYRKLDAYSPMPIEGLAEAIGFTKNRLPLIVLCGGLLGATTAYVMMYFSAVIHYPLNIGGRGLHSWPAFVPITFELTILFGSFAAVLGMLGLNGLPMPYHPVFNVPQFALASRNRFFLCIEAIDPKFDIETTRRFLESQGPKSVAIVER
jgi:Protein of unknown function (DUF3341)